MNKKKWAQVESPTKLLLKLGEEVGEVFKAWLDSTTGGNFDQIIEELDHVILIATRLRGVLDV